MELNDYCQFLKCGNVVAVMKKSPLLEIHIEVFTDENNVISRSDFEIATQINKDQLVDINNIN